MDDEQNFEQILLLPPDWQDPIMKHRGKDNKLTVIEFHLPSPEEIGRALFYAVGLVTEKQNYEAKQKRAYVKGLIEHDRRMANLKERLLKTFYAPTSKGKGARKK